MGRWFLTCWEDGGAGVCQVKGVEKLVGVGAVSLDNAVCAPALSLRARSSFLGADLSGLAD
eukprot:3452736-Rhodomonas_salina.1